ncbi:hypothetical protein B7463_g3212, partial [Scytalidium lignicola]
MDTKVESRTSETSDIPNNINSVDMIQAANGQLKETDMTIQEGLQKHYKAMLWSGFLSIAVIMEGYDALLLSSLFGLPAFKEGYGEELADGSFNISAKWQSSVTQAVKVGQFFGLFIAGWVADKYGFKKTTMGTCVITAALIFMQFFATSIELLMVAQLLVGFPLGVFMTLTTVYAAEICPLVLRPYLISWVNLCWTIGKLIAAGVLRSFVNDHSQWAYRIPFATQWIWPPIVLFGTIFAPESPWWYIRQNRPDDARRSLKRLSSGVTAEEIDNTVADITLTNEHELELQSGTSYLDCFRGTNLRRTEIACMIWLTQPLCGFAIVGFATYFFQQAGLSADDAFSLSLGQQGIAFCGGIVAWFLLPRVGRRTLMLWGLAASVVSQMIIGGLGVPLPKNGMAWATGCMLLIYVLAYSLTIGPICYIIVAEIGSSRLRNKTAVLARNAYQIATIVSGILTSYQVNSTAWNWRGKAGFFWGTASIILWVYCYFRLPEIKDRTFLELDLLFENKVKAKSFNKTKVNTINEVMKGKETK